MGNQSACSNHCSSHAVSDEEDNVLCLAFFCQVADDPCGLGLAAIVVMQSGGIFAGLVKSNTAVGFGSYVDERGFLCVARE